MLSDSDESLESNSSRSSITNSEAESFDSGEEFQLDIGDEPYQDEPLASDGGESDDDEETDIDGLTPATLEARFEKRIPVQEWLVNLSINLFKKARHGIIQCFFLRCKCSHCNEENLQDALEFRCCHEITNAIGKLVFDGSIERVSCITQHEDYEALINKTVLLQVAPLLRDQNGRGYRRQNGASENE